MEISEKTIRGCVSRNRKYQKEIYEKLYPALMGICMRYTKDSQEAKDVLHDGFIKILNKINTYNFNGNFEGWAKKIIVNTAIDRYRSLKKKVRLTYEENIKDESLVTDEEINLYKNLDACDVIKLVQELAPSHRTALNLYLMEGFTHEEISKMLGISIGTSKSNLFKAKRAMSNKLKNIFENERL
jgi:RNA polymerase sigma-70 factor (ECF subfamily)